MILTGRVIEVKTGKSSREHEFVRFALSPGPGRSAILTIPNDEGWELEDPVQVSISMGTPNEVAVDKRDKRQKAPTTQELSVTSSITLSS